MDKRLETYLQTVKNELGGLEAEQRVSELREVRQHIEAIVTRLVEGGLNENEATEAAIAQFGAARQVGRELNRVSQARDSWWRILAASVGAVETYNLLLLVFSWAGGWSMHAMGVPQLLTAALFAYFPVIAGASAGIIARSWNERILACLCVAFSALYSGSWFNWPLSSLSLLFLVFLGAFFGSRWNLRFSLGIERTEPTRS